MVLVGLLLDRGSRSLDFGGILLRQRLEWKPEKDEAGCSSVGEKTP